MYTGPNITTDGLVFAIDVANVKSYTSGSTVWRDLVNSTVSGSLNGVVFDQDKKCLLFSSASSSVCAFNNSEIMNFNTSSFTIEVLVKITSPAIGNNNVIWQKRNGIAGIGTLKGYQYRILANNANNASTIISVDNGTTNNSAVIIDKPTFPYNTLIHSFLIFNSSSLKLSEYRNGVLVCPENLSISNMTGSFYNNNINFLVGKNPNEGNSLDAEYYFLKAYNRILTAEEVLQTYNAMKIRFGL